MTGVIAAIRSVLGRNEREPTAPDIESAASNVPANPSDAYYELGVSAEEVLVELVRIDGGWAWQSDLVAATEWAESTVSRRLDDLEAEGRLVRRAAGRRNVVGFPETLPAADEGVSSPRARGTGGGGGARRCRAGRDRT